MKRNEGEKRGKEGVKREREERRGRDTGGDRVREERERMHTLTVSISGKTVGQGPLKLRIEENILSIYVYI